MAEEYRGEVYDDGKGNVNFRLEPSDRMRTFETNMDFRLGVNDDPAKLATIAKEIREKGGSIVFPATEEIRSSYSRCGAISKAEIDYMRGFTDQEQQRVLAA